MDNIDFSKYKYLFLDRDGVINVERPNDYAKKTSEFIFIDGVVDAIAELTNRFDRTFIVTNQRGIGRGLFSHQDLANVHKHMFAELENKGGSIDQIYYCTDLKDSSINRKPNTGMGFRAQCDYPEVNFFESILIGNSKSDIIFGNKLGMLTVLVGDKYQKGDTIYDIIDIYCENLSKFVEKIKHNTH